MYKGETDVAISVPDWMNDWLEKTGEASGRSRHALAREILDAAISLRNNVELNRIWSHGITPHDLRWIRDHQDDIQSVALTREFLEAEPDESLRISMLTFFMAWKTTSLIGFGMRRRCISFSSS